MVLCFSVLVQAWKGGTARSSPQQFQVHQRCKQPRICSYDPRRSYKKPSWWWNQQALSWTRNKALQHWSRRWCVCQSQIVRVQVESLLLSVLSKTKSQIHHRRHRVVWKKPTWREQAGRHDEDHIQRSKSLSSVHQSFRPGFSNNRAFTCECTRPPYRDWDWAWLSKDVWLLAP